MPAKAIKDYYRLWKLICQSNWSKLSEKASQCQRRPFNCCI